MNNLASTKDTVVKSSLPVFFHSTRITLQVAEIVMTSLVLGTRK